MMVSDPEPSNHISLQSPNGPPSQVDADGIERLSRVHLLKIQAGVAGVCFELLVSDMGSGLNDGWEGVEARPEDAVVRLINDAVHCR